MADQIRVRAPEEFSITIDFKPNVGDPTRIFRSAIALIENFARFDQELVRAFNTQISSTIRLEQIEEGSLRIWLKTFLESLDDDALKSGDWKKVVGVYLLTQNIAFLTT